MLRQFPLREGGLSLQVRVEGLAVLDGEAADPSFVSFGHVWEHLHMPRTEFYGGFMSTLLM